jgi:DNA polymerase/3'-5' exonuclease PolX
MIARSLRNLSVEEAIKQLEFSDKRSAKKILHNLAFARKNATEQKDMKNLVICKYLIQYLRDIQRLTLCIFSPSMGWQGKIYPAYQGSRPWSIWYHAS